MISAKTVPPSSSGGSIVVVRFILPFCRKNVRLAVDPIIHKNYDTDDDDMIGDDDNDIALLKLAESVHLTPVCLPKVDTDYTDKAGMIYGGLLR
jgi:hypothetical protein